MSKNKEKRSRGRPVKNVMPEPIPDTPENVALTAMKARRKRTGGISGREVKRMKQISRSSEHYSTGETESRPISDATVEFGDGHVIDAGIDGMDGPDDPVAFANELHDEEHGGTGKESIRSLSKKEAALSKLNDIQKRLENLK